MSPLMAIFPTMFEVAVVLFIGFVLFIFIVLLLDALHFGVSLAQNGHRIDVLFLLFFFLSSQLH